MIQFYHLQFDTKLMMS